MHCCTSARYRINRPGVRRPCDPSASTRAAGQSPCCGASGCGHSTRRCLGVTFRPAGRESGGTHLRARAGRRHGCSAAEDACCSAGWGGGDSRAAGVVQRLGVREGRAATDQGAQRIQSCCAAVCCRATSASERTGPCCAGPCEGHECPAGRACPSGRACLVGRACPGGREHREDHACRAGRPAWGPPFWDPSASGQLA